MDPPALGLCPRGARLVVEAIPKKSPSSHLRGKWDEQSVGGSLTPWWSPTSHLLEGLAWNGDQRPLEVQDNLLDRNILLAGCLPQGDVGKVDCQLVRVEGQ